MRTQRRGSAEAAVRYPRGAARSESLARPTPLRTNPRTVVSIGYERRSLEEFAAALQTHDVRKLVDVREAPISRRREFNKNVLARHLQGLGIQYRHIRAAGNPYRHESLDIRRCLGLYAAHLRANPDAVVAVVGEISDQFAVAILCYERQQQACHRSVLIHALEEAIHGLRVVKVE